MKYKYYSLYEMPDKRRIYTFDNETAAHDVLELIIRNDFMPTDIIVEEHEATT